MFINVNIYFTDELTFVRIVLEKRLIGRERLMYKTTVDGTDFRICEATPFDRKWYSHKFKGPGLRYEIALSIERGNIVWAYGLFECCAFSDLKIYRSRLKQCLMDGEKVVADQGHPNDTCSGNEVTDGTADFAFLRARHEATNKRLKQFNVLSSRFRHNLFLHQFCYFAVLDMVQISIEHGEEVFHGQ